MSDCLTRHYSFLPHFAAPPRIAVRHQPLASSLAIAIGTEDPGIRASAIVVDLPRSRRMYQSAAAYSQDMQWANLQTHGDTPHRAFEALCSLLFERWCGREFADRLTTVYVTGAGGDGGVESLARLDDGSVIGLQCKWFRDPLQTNHFTQITSSLKTAAQLRAGLTRYLVAVPRNLADGVDRDGSTTERQRWNRFVDRARVDFPNVEVELWDEAKIETLLAEVGSKGVVSYWFSQIVVDQTRLERLFKQATAGWLANRYSPDLHQVGEIETSVTTRLNRQDLPAEWRRWCTTLRRLIREAQTAIAQLAHVQAISGAPSLKSAKASVAILAQYADDLASRLNGPATPSVRVPLRAPHFNIDDLIASLDERRGHDSVRHHREAVEKLATEWAQQSVTSQELDALASPVVFMADAGAGKTHACAHLVERALARNEPAVLIRARDFPPGSSTWTRILQHCIEETGLSLEELLDALVSSARRVDVQNAAANGGQEVTHPCRPLVVIDGLDESVGATHWATRLAELPASIGLRPLTFVATCRPSVLRDHTNISDVSLVAIEGSDPDLNTVFAAYIKASRIDAPPVVRWWLRSPLEVRLFADVFEGASRDALSTQSFRVHELIRRKLELIAEALAPTQGVTAATAAPLVRKKLVDFADALLRAGGPVSHMDALACLRGSGADEFPNASLVLETLRDRGILLEIPSTTIDPLEDAGPHWDFAFETLHSYIIATRYKSSAYADSLPYLHEHPQALLFTLVLQENANESMLMDESWSTGLYHDEVLDLRLAALSLMEFSRAERHRTYIEERLVASMPSCRAVLHQLVIPGMRVPGYPFGARFVFDRIKDLEVAARDVFWSGPRELNSEDAPWSGSGVEALEGEPLTAADAWNTAPLLVLMSAASVVEAHRREVVWSIARWGAAQPVGLSKLLEALFDGFNDPQVLEDGAAAAWTAVCLNPSSDWSRLAEVVRTLRWARAFPHVPTLRFIRYCELLVSMIEKKRAALSIAAPPVLPIDTCVGESVNKEIGYGPIKNDLTWYVTPRGIGVFERAPAYGKEDAFDDWQWNQNRDEILRAFVEGRIRAGSPKEAIDQARRFIDDDAAVYADDDAYDVDASGDVGDDGEGAPNSLASQAAEGDTPWSERLRELLRLHADRYDLDKLTPRALAYGYVMERAAELGWSESLEVGDQAIQGAYRRATHGSRSEVCSFFEKYLWIARGELRAFLSLSLADADPKGRLAPDRIEDVDNPADLMNAVSVHVPLSRWDTLVAPVNLTEKWDQQRANEWVRLSPPVDIRDAALLSGRDLRASPATPSALPEDSQWITIQGYLHLREANSQVDRLVWLSALLIEKEDIAILEEDAQAGLLLSRHDLDETQAGLARDGTYVGPFEALWMTDSEIQTPMVHTTLVVRDTKPAVAEIPMYPAVVESHWKGLRESTFSYPSRALRESLAITAYRNGCFMRSDGTIVAVRAEFADVDEWNEAGWGPPSAHWLLVRRDLLVDQLQGLKGGSALLVAMRSLTEPAGYLREREVGWDCIEQRSLLIIDGLTDRAPIEETKRLTLPEPDHESALDAITSLVGESDDSTRHADDDMTKEG